MLKESAAIMAGCIIAAGVGMGTAQADSGEVKLRNVDLITCPSWADERGLCSRGEPALRLVFSVPACWTVDVRHGLKTSSVNWTSQREEECLPTKTKPRLVRVIVAF